MTVINFIRICKMDTKIKITNLIIIFNEFLGAVGSGLKRGETIYIRGFGKFCPPPKNVKWKGQNNYRWVVFRPYKDLKDKVNNKKSVYAFYKEVEELDG